MGKLHRPFFKNISSNEIRHFHVVSHALIRALIHPGFWITQAKFSRIPELRFPYST